MTDKEAPEQGERTASHQQNYDGAEDHLRRAITYMRCLTEVERAALIAQFTREVGGSK